MHAQSCPTIWDPMVWNPPGSSVHEFFRQEYWSGLPFPSPGGLPDPGIKLKSPASPALAGEFFTTAPPRKPEIECGEKYKVQHSEWESPMTLNRCALGLSLFISKLRRLHWRTSAVCTSQIFLGF